MASTGELASHLKCVATLAGISVSYTTVAMLELPPPSLDVRCFLEEPPVFLVEEALFLDIVEVEGGGTKAETRKALFSLKQRKGEWQVFGKRS